VELLKHYTNQALAYKHQALLKPGLDDDPLARLLGYFEGSISSFQSNGGSCPCLIVKLAAEVMDLNAEMREVIATGFASGLEIYETVLKQAVEEGLVPKDLDTGRTAQVMQDLWYGALQRAVASKSVKPLRNALTVIKETLHAPVAA
jgi:TetR/AcrR family transcriptional repressor of nem operon